MKCTCCQKEFKKRELESIRLSDDNGFCQSSWTAHICIKCWDKAYHRTNKGEFLFLKYSYSDFNLRKKGLFYYKPCYWSLVRSEEELDYIFNRDYYNMLDLFEETL